jgi:hypothetical protein
MAMAAGEPGKVGEQNVLILASRIETSGMLAIFTDRTEEVTTWMDAVSGRPIRRRSLLRRGDRSNTLDIDGFTPDGFKVTNNDSAGEREVTGQAIPMHQGAYDLASSLLALRGWKGEPGSRAQLYVLSTWRVWRVNILYSGVEKIKTQHGSFPCRRLDGITVRLGRDGQPEEEHTRRLSMWISDDEHRLPLRMATSTSIGAATAELATYHSSGLVLSGKPSH